MFSLYMFGGLRLLDDDGRDVAFPEKGLLIIAYLMADPTARASRNGIAQLLWGRDDNGSAQANLRKLVSRVRSRQAALGKPFLRFTDTTIELDTPPAGADILPAEMDDAQPILVRLDLLVNALESEFLQDVDCESPVFVHWRETQKHRHMWMLKETLKIAAEEASAAADVARVKEAAILALGADPEDRDIHRILLRIFDAAGEVEHFRQIFQQRGKLLASWSDRQGRASMPHANATDLRTGAGKLRVPLLLMPPLDRPEMGYDIASLVQDITVGFYALDSLDVRDRCTAVKISRLGEGAVASFDQHNRSYVLDMRLSGHHDEPVLFSQLVETATDEVVWAERLVLGQSSPEQQKLNIARHIVLSLAGQIERREMVRSHFATNPAAYQRYLAGRRYLDRLSVPNLQRARLELETSLQKSGDFAPALSSLARTYSKEWLLKAGGDMALLREAENYALQAIAARPGIADGYRELGVAKTFQGITDENIEALELAEALNPNHAGIIADHAEALVYASRLDLGLEKIERAIALNPVSPDSYFWIASAASYMGGDFEKALGYIDRMADGRLADRIAAASWAMLGQQERADFFVRRVHENNPGFDVDRWLSVIPIKEQWQRDIYYEGLRRAGFWKNPSDEA
ncbi:hypothetical protein HGP17_03230 [Rhizobium sp. P38BS-XIX]|uniref:hypothetical protein n=1 Tax=Rhizobium sp. P38BS-XIX TaxID=2726740 RepID=UPI0014573461|nr:hypothetical protein [Rhizobium sp. P38BS-XIX]NLR95844.1 hypothetical protein [Rhizobium sp. P38BS-XIX]